MFRFTLFLAALVATVSLCAQEPPAMLAPSMKDTTPVIGSETQAEFPGGQDALAAYMVKEVEYPRKAKKAGVQGQVVVGFVVDKDGSVVDVRVVRGVDPLLDAEAVRAVQSMPKWRPGTMNGKPVKVMYTLPVRFKLVD